MLMLLSSCTEGYRMSYQELNDRYESLQRDYYELEEEYHNLEQEMYEDYILEDDILSFLSDVYDEQDDYIHKKRIEELINYHCW